MRQRSCRSWPNWSLRSTLSGNFRIRFCIIVTASPPRPFSWRRRAVSICSWLSSGFYSRVESTTASAASRWPSASSNPQRSSAMSLLLGEFVSAERYWRIAASLSPNDSGIAARLPWASKSSGFASSDIFKRDSALFFPRYCAIEELNNCKSLDELASSPEYSCIETPPLQNARLNAYFLFSWRCFG